jgi:hypothetical protein
MFRSHSLAGIFLAAGLIGLPIAQVGKSKTTTVHVKVTTSAGSIPCRITVVDSKGELADTRVAPANWIATRKGVVYSSRGEAEIALLPGRYTVYATRGFEYSLARQPIEVGDKAVEIPLKLAREVDTAGFVSCDTHIHTLTHSGHGDATEAERLVTLAGEGVELPITTEHNLAIRYPTKREATDPQAWFTPVVGDEVTTSNGHFNVFPLDPSRSVPDYRSTDWKAVLSGIRAANARVVILNHPTDLHSNYRPADSSRFHAASGESLDGRDWAFDGIEVVNSGAMQSDEMSPFRVWFALLNRGKKITGIGASDSHDVNLYIVGQGRTYIKSSAKSPDKIDINEACENLLAGRSLVSLGLLCEMLADGHGGGDLVTDSGADIPVRLRVQGPRWVTADRVELYANGQLVASRPIVHRPDAIVKADLTLKLPKPAHDQWLVAIATGPGVREPYWPLSRPYQPTRADWDPRLIAASGVVRIDGDGDGKYSSPHDYGSRLVERSGGDPRKLMEVLRGYDEAAAVQAASVCREKGMELRSGPFQGALNAASPATVLGFNAYLNLLPPTTK